MSDIDMMLNSQRTREMLEVLRELATAAPALIALLNEEHEALRGGAPERIETLSQAKQALVGRIETLDQQRSEILRAGGADPATPLAQLADLVPTAQQPATLQLSARLVQDLGECAQLNRRNGAIIHISQQFTQRLLATLHGRAPSAAEVSLYGRSGQTVAGGGESTAVVAV